jgi:hypothetical protein
MSQIGTYLAAPLTQFGAIAVCCLTFAGSLVWLAGLLIILRGSKPRERPDIIRAYATCRPFIPVLPRVGRRSSRSRSEDN